ncbi:hypothetical protein QZH52_25825 [Variovorax ginsengisoli]|uniref:Uncharacterized protein n=1 Tax=Variovorax ginsengisoli TaxID=363844 RepID=A0ABT8S9W7_9BURK|nr:hypothetical protein [Variovorax ginsengisoli]MDN8616538.1 hypothetical protein [Variovorax ginsengisoli]MDO1535708.1 hypothetical protein [Variovorax ginsengisoli]
MTAPETALQGKVRANAHDLYMSLELSDKRWNLTFGDAYGTPAGALWPLAIRGPCWNA